MQKRLNELETDFDTNLQCGLSASKVEQNREKYGKNALQEKKKSKKTESSSFPGR